MRPNHGQAGYSLVELLLAMGLFAALSTGLVALLGRSSEFLATGSSQTETMDAQQAFAQAFSEDIARMASRPDADVGRPDVRLVSDWVDCDLDGDKKPDLKAERLFFVRVAPGQDASEVSALSGTKPGADGYVDQNEDLKQAREGKLKASGGLMEVFWTAIPEDKDDPAVLQLRRGYRAPPGGPGSLIPSRAARDPQAGRAERGPVDGAEIRAATQPVLSGVLYFGVDFWSRKTTTWDSKIRPRDGGPLPTWDSTRGILPQGDGDTGDSFYLSKKRTMMESTSLDDPTDDTFPRKVRVVCVVEELGRNARVGYLGDEMSIESKSVRVSDLRFFPATDTSQRFVKIDAEWMEVGTPEGTTIPVIRRGVRGTAVATHAAGAKVHHGRTFTAEYDVAAFRDTYREELGSDTGRAGWGK